MHRGRACIAQSEHCFCALIRQRIFENEKTTQRNARTIAFLFVRRREERETDDSRQTIWRKKEKLAKKSTIFFFSNFFENERFTFQSGYFLRPRKLIPRVFYFFNENDLNVFNAYVRVISLMMSTYTIHLTDRDHMPNITFRKCFKYIFLVEKIYLNYKFKKLRANTI